MDGLFTGFFETLRRMQVPVTLREYLSLLSALEADVAELKRLLESAQSAPDR